MKCYHCNENEADNRFWVSFMGQTGEVHLCSECLEKIMQYTKDMLRHLQEHPAEFAPTTDWVESDFGGQIEQSPPPRPLGEDPFPLDAGADVRRDRQLNELKARLEIAVERERYEEAASLRDEIYRMEDGVRIYDT